MKKCSSCSFLMRTIVHIFLICRTVTNETNGKEREKSKFATILFLLLCYGYHFSRVPIVGYYTQLLREMIPFPISRCFRSFTHSLIHSFIVSVFFFSLVVVAFSPLASKCCYNQFFSGQYLKYMRKHIDAQHANAFSIKHFAYVYFISTLYWCI